MKPSGVDSVISYLPSAIEVLLSLLIIFVVSCCVPRWKKLLKYKNLPPGPFSWPLVGYLPFLDKNNNHLVLRQLCKTYGGVIGIYVGMKYVVFIDDFEVLKECFGNEDFLWRPREPFQISDDPNEISIVDSNGQSWKEQRQFFHRSLRLIGTYTEEFRALMQDLISGLVKYLHTVEGQDLNLTRVLEVPMNNLSFRMAYGKILPNDHQLIRLQGKYNDAMLGIYEATALKTFFPWASVFIPFLPRLWNTGKPVTEMESEIRKEVSEHLATLNEVEPRDYIDLFLINMKKEGLEKEFNPATLLANLKVIVGASSETTRNALVWFFLLMVKYQEVQEEIQKEIDLVVGRERDPVSSDKQKLPFLHAAIMESMRFRNIEHFGLPRQAMKDSKLCGYDIPEGTFIFHNMTSHFRNPEYWERPDEFDPTRFLSEQRDSIRIPEHYIPFSYGKRNCPGEKMANNTMFLFCSRLLQKFTFLPPEGGINIDIKVDFLNVQASPFLRVQSRF